MKNNYALIICIEREISCLGVFETLDNAQAAMREDYNKYHLNDLEMDVEDFEDCDDTECSIDAMSAYSNCDDDKCVDWKIVNISGEQTAIEREYELQLARTARLICPRCGGPMRDKLFLNARSRRAEIFVCPDCGTQEALESLHGATKMPLDEWYINRTAR